jgi:multiple sugar transport system substrate-binding protein
MARSIRKLTRRDLLGLAAGVGAAAALAACGAPSGTPTAIGTSGATAARPTTAATSAPAGQVASSSSIVEIRFQSRGGNDLLKIAQDLAKEFMKVHPNIRVKNDHTNGDHFQKILTEVAAGNPPDAYHDASVRTGGLGWKKKVIEDLEPYLKADKRFKDDDHIPGAWLTEVYDHRRTAVAYDSGAMALFFNIDLFKAANVPLPDPKKRMTWDELLDKAIKLTLDVNGKHPGEPGFDPSRIKQYGFNPTTVHGHEHWFYTIGGEIIDENGKVTPVMTRPETIEGYQKLADWGAKHLVAPNPEYKQTQPIDFRSGNVAMEENGVWLIGRVNEVVKNWGVAPFPMQKIPVSYGQYSGQCMTRLSKHKDQTWEWMYWVSLSKDGQKFLADAGLLQPTRKDLQDYFVNNPKPPAKEYRQVFVDELNNGDTLKWPGQAQQTFYLGYRQYWIDAFGPMYDAVLRGKKQYKEIAAEVGRVMDTILSTGEPATS